MTAVADAGSSPRNSSAASAVSATPKPPTSSPRPTPSTDLGEGDLEPLVSGVRAVLDEGQRRLRRRPDALLGEDLVHDVLADTEVLAGGEQRLDQRLHRASEPAQHLAGARVVGVAVDPSLGAAQRDVAIALGVDDRLLQRHRLREVAHLVQGDAVAHPEAATGNATAQGVDDDVALDPGELVGPGQLEVGVVRAHRGDPSGGGGSEMTRTVGPWYVVERRSSAVRSSGVSTRTPRAPSA